MAKQVQLSKRLKMLADLVTPGNVTADVGCDHGFLSIYLIQNGISPRVIASDVRQGPLDAAREHIAEWKLENYIETRLSDGLMDYYPGEAKTLVCAGMGGRLMQQILMQSEPVTREFEEMILQPQSELMQFRTFLREQEYSVAKERLVCEDGKYYFAFRVVHQTAEDPAGEALSGAGAPGLDVRHGNGNGYLDERFDGRLGGFDGKFGGVDCTDQRQRLYDKFGRQLLLERNPVLKEYLEKSLQTAQTIREQMTANLGGGPNLRLAESIAENETDEADIRAALAFFE